MVPVLLLKLPHNTFGPVDWTGPHYLALLDYLAAALEEESFGGSAQHLSRLLRRTMCKLLHDLMGQKILRKIKQLN